MNRPFPSYLNPLFQSDHSHNHSYENEFNLHVNEISFSYERMSTKTRFEKEAKGNSEMAYYHLRICLGRTKMEVRDGRGKIASLLRIESRAY